MSTSGPPPPRPGPGSVSPAPPFQNPNTILPNSNSLPDDMQNLHFSRPPPPSIVPRPSPPPFSAVSPPATSSPFASSAGTFPGPTTVASRPFARPRGDVPTQAPPFASRPNGPSAASSLHPPLSMGSPPGTMRGPPPVSQGSRPSLGSPLPPLTSAGGSPLAPLSGGASPSPFMGPPQPAQQQAFTGRPPFRAAPAVGLVPNSSTLPPYPVVVPAPPAQQQAFAGPPPFGAALQVGPMPTSSVSAPSPFLDLPQPPQKVFVGPPPFGTAPQVGPVPTSSAPPFGSSPMWQTQAPRSGAPLISDSMQPLPRMYGMSPSMPGLTYLPTPQMMGNTLLGGPHVSAQSKIDPNQIPRPMPSSTATFFATRQGNQPTSPPPATSEFVVQDTGNCSPRLMRCTINQIPCTADLLSTSSMPLALMVQPLALPHPKEEPIQVVDFGESGPVRCSRCKAYVNPFMRFIDQGKRFFCNLCGFIDETPRDYFCHLGPDGRRRDADDRPELCRGTVEFVATKEYMVREPMAAVFFFLVDVSMNAIQTGATAAACSAISQSLSDIPEGPRTMVGVATFDSCIHFYSLRQSLQQPVMLVVPDVQDVYTPMSADLIVQLAECRHRLEQLLDNIPTMFESNKVAESAFGAAVKAAFLALKSTGGKLLVFQSVLPSIGIGSLSSREAEGRTNISSSDKEAHKLLQPADKMLKTMAIEFAEYQVCVDVFITTQSYVDIASISVVPITTGGQVYFYHPFSALSDSAKLYNDLRWNITRPQGFEAVMRVRCSQGLQIQEYLGNFCKRIPTDIDLPAFDYDKTIMVTFKHDDKFQDGAECGFQCAVLYTTVYGQRRIRVMNLSLPCTNTLSNLFRSADLDTQFACFVKQAANGIPTSPLSQVREQLTNICINILHSYRKFCATVSSSGQLILPEALKLLPLYMLALVKSIGLRNEGRLDDRSYWVSRASSLSISLAIPFVYPRMISLHDLTAKDDDGPLIPSAIPLSSEHVNEDGIYLLENGEDGLVYVGSSVRPDILQQIFGNPSVDGLQNQFVLQQYDNELSKKVIDIVNEIRRQRCSYLRLRLCRKGDPSGMLFFSYMVEDKNPGGFSYVEFLVHVHRQIQTRMG